jgi:hypothetical protein
MITRGWALNFAAVKARMGEQDDRAGAPKSGRGSREAARMTKIAPAADNLNSMWQKSYERARQQVPREHCSGQ